MRPDPEERKLLRVNRLHEFKADENGLSAHGIFGLPFSEEESEVILLPVPWEVTVSYGAGTAKGPEAILHASQQIDLYDPVFPLGWQIGIAMREVSDEWNKRNEICRAQAALYLQEVTSVM
ncbi:MAG: arginase family protein, partial [Bacteroidota bacterium]|nr:arginase family protein [Bacteroidota bacterium]